MSEANQNATATEKKSTKGKDQKKIAKPKATAPKAKAQKADSKPKRDKAPKEDLVVFAFRMDQAERTKLHEMAGPAQASRVMRALAVAFTREDEGAFKSVLIEAKKLRA